MFEFIATWNSNNGLVVKGFNDSEQAYEQVNEWDDMDTQILPIGWTSQCSVVTWQEWQEVCLCNAVDPLEPLQSSQSLKMN
jgi:hypothetical protein